MMNADILKKIIDKHQHWLYEDCDGWETMKADLHCANLMYANLSGADLYGANLYDADLHCANLSGADLDGANLMYANLSGANLSCANLSGADLYGANLSCANLMYANLSGADLHCANLSGANLSCANLSGAQIDEALMNRFFPLCCPEYGSFIGWKKANGHIVKLQITEDAKRSSAFGRKCRCNKALVLNIENIDGSDSGLTEIASGFDRDFIYRVGETVEVKDFNNNRKRECAPGIHFFITRKEAVDYW